MRVAIFTVLAVLVVVAAILIGPAFGLLGGFAFAAVAGSALTGLYKLTAREPERLSAFHTAGHVACPRCGSMQTDEFIALGADNVERARMTCYACDHRCSGASR